MNSMKKTAISTAIVAALGLASTTHLYAVDANVTNMFFAPDNYASTGTLKDDTGDFGLMESVDNFFGAPWAAAGVAYFEPGLVPTEDADTATDSGNISNNAMPTNFGPLTSHVFQSNGPGVAGGTSYTWSGIATASDNPAVTTPFSYDFELQDDQVAWGTLFNWNGNIGIPVLNIMKCEDPQGTVPQNCAGKGTPMATLPFPGQRPKFSGTGTDFTPVATADNLSAAAGVVKTIDVVLNDSDKDVPASPPLAAPGDVTVTFPATSDKGGTLTDNGDGTVDYTSVGLTAPDSDTFDYTITDANGKSSTATVTLSITASVNTAPVAIGGAVVVDEDLPVVIMIAGVATDSDMPAQALTFVNVGVAASGTVVANVANTELTYTPDPNYNGPDQFTYSVNDGFDDSAAPGTITITVNSVNDAPVCVPVAKATGVDIALDIPHTDLVASCTDVEGDPIMFLSADQPASGGMVADNGADTLTYTPAVGFEGNDSFIYRVTDGTDPSAGSNVNIQVGGALLGNFTMLQADGSKFGGTNDISFTFLNGADPADPATLNNDVSDTVINLEIKSETPTAFFGELWQAHDIRVFGPGNYSFDSGCTPAEVQDNGCLPGTAAKSGPTISMTIPAGMIGAHMLFDWSGNNNLAVVNVWELNGVWDTHGKPFPQNALWKLGGGVPPADDATWALVSTDLNSDGFNGTPMVAGPFVNNYVNFNHQPSGVGVEEPPFSGVADDTSLGGSMMSVWTLLTGLLSVLGFRRFVKHKQNFKY